MLSFESEYSMSSINSINDNIFNNKLAKSSKYRFRKIFKPILKMLLQKNKKTKKPICNCRNSYDNSSEISDNSLNERLEKNILNEIKNSVYPNIYVSDNENQLFLVPRHQPYVPVHFARTNVGTFFWTTFDDNMESQLPQLQFNRYDRWIQA